MRKKFIRDKLLIIPGYVVGIICLMIITYRSLLAFLNENKAITIYINKYGEQYFDIAALAVIWSICLIGLFFLIKTLREELLLKKNNYNLQKNPILNKKDYFFDLNSEIKLNNKKATFIGFSSNSYNELKQKFKEKE